MGLIEALAYGLPSLVTRGSNMMEEIRNAQAGWTSETTVEGIKQSLRQMIADKKQFQSISHNARLLASRYDWDVLAQQFHQEIIKLCK